MLEVAVFAKAPVPGFTKTRLIPVLRPGGAAAFQRKLMEQAVRTALEAGIGPATLWCAPDPSHQAFADLAARFAVGLAPQVSGDLGARMLAAFDAAAPRPLVLIGTDCPSLGAQDLRDAADALRGGADVAIAPAEDGGYGLIAAHCPMPILFRDMPWSTAKVMSLTRERARAAGLTLVERQTIWDVDTPADYERLVASGLLTVPELLPS
ncbi:MAG TPA: TIGR04282 family arsenosugar biosynthesis glycosyltransferase [Beijerinckiaceae bacterium]|nr:TIGR04282 family arsenosugar biosynthesis glycosyltransferase [Beijerinckiaceae bacterium]